MARQLEYDKALLASKQLAAEIYKGHDKLHHAHMAAVASKFNRCKELRKAAEARAALHAQLSQDLRDQQLANTYLQEEIGDQLDTMSGLETQVSCLKKEIVQSSQRQYKYLQELNELVTDMDEPITQYRAELHQTKAYRHELQRQRDGAFKAMVDLQVER